MAPPPAMSKELNILLMRIAVGLGWVDASRPNSTNPLLNAKEIDFFSYYTSSEIKRMATAHGIADASVDLLSRHPETIALFKV
jgi:hypothetical protein